MAAAPRFTRRDFCRVRSTVAGRFTHGNGSTSALGTRQRRPLLDRSRKRDGIRDTRRAMAVRLPCKRAKLRGPAHPAVRGAPGVGRGAPRRTPSEMRTERLSLREPDEADADALRAYYARNAERFARW